MSYVFNIVSAFFLTLVGSFSKGIAGALSINFAPSGGVNCHKSCTLYARCYGTKTEKRQPNIKTNLDKKAENPIRYIRELADNARLIALAPWVRFSVFGSMPNNPTPEWLENFVKLASELNPNITHFPVETIRKANIVREAGLNPRVSAGLDHDRVKHILKNNHLASLVLDLGVNVNHKNKKRLGRVAIQKAKEFKQLHGVTVKVCPAIIGQAKCGACKLCARKDIPIVIYPKH